MKKECACNFHYLEQGDTLYVMSSWDGGIGFDYIHDIKFCPVCGNKLPNEDESEIFYAERMNNYAD